MQIPQPEYIIGTVYYQDPVTGACDVDLFEGDSRVPGIPVLGTSCSPMSNDVETPFGSLKGAKVLMMTICDKWYILTTIPTENSGPSGTSVSSTSTGTGGDNPLTFKRANGESDDKNSQQPSSSSVKKYTGGRSTDMISGDKKLSADGGSELLLGKEGLVVLKASDLSQLILGAYKDFARIVARDFELFTDFGTVRFTSGGETGSAGLAIVGGGHLADESSTLEPSNTVRLFIGDVPWDVMGRYALQVDSPKGDQHMRTEMDINGNRETYISNTCAERSKFRISVVEDSEHQHVLGGQKIAIGMGGIAPADEGDLRDDVEALPAGDRLTDIKNNETLNVKEGNYTLNVDTGNQSVTVKGKRTVHADDKIEESTDSDKDLSVAGTLNLMLGGLSISGHGGHSGTLTMKTSNPINLVKV